MHVIDVMAMVMDNVIFVMAMVMEVMDIVIGSKH